MKVGALRRWSVCIVAGCALCTTSPVAAGTHRLSSPTDVITWRHRQTLSSIRNSASHKPSAAAPDVPLSFEIGSTLGSATLISAGVFAVDSRGNFYAAAREHSLVKFDANGTLIAAWDGLGLSHGEPDQITGIAVDENRGYVYASDMVADRVVKLNLDLQVQTTLGASGNGPGQLTMPEGLALAPNGDLYVADFGNQRIVRFSPAGQFLNAWDVWETSVSVPYVDVSASGHVFVPATLNGYIAELKAGNVTRLIQDRDSDFFPPQDLALIPAGFATIDWNTYDIIVLSHGGHELARFGADNAGMWKPLALENDARGNLFALECTDLNQAQALPRPDARCRIAQITQLGKIVRTWTSADNDVPVPGTNTSIGDRSLHLYCVGEGSPTVVFVSSFFSDAREWTYLQNVLGRETRTCTYDRAGLGSSDPGPSAPEAEAVQIADDLAALLLNAGEPGPYVVAGFSVGGSYARLFAYRNMEDMAGVVQIDGSISDQCNAYSTPPEFCPVPLVFEQVLAATPNGVAGSLGALPLVLLTRGLGLDSVWEAGQVELRTASTNVIRVQADRSPHSIPLSQPSVVIEGIRRAINAARDPDGHLEACGPPFPTLHATCL